MTSNVASTTTEEQSPTTPLLLEPTIVALPPRPSPSDTTEENNTITKNTTETTTTPATATRTAAISTTADSTMLNDTSRDAEIAAALAAEDEVVAASIEQERLFAQNRMGNIQNVTANGTNQLQSSLPPPNTTTGSMNSAGISNSYSSSNSTNGNETNYTVATVSAPWQYDDLHSVCYKCHNEFHPIVNRKHHCRYCGYVFCHNCTNYKALIPPSMIVLHPITGKKTKPPDANSQLEHISFSPNPDPDRMLTYIAPNNSTGSNSANHMNGSEQQPQLLYGRGLEERFQLAREPLRVCYSCYQQVQPLQEDLRYHNSHAMRYNAIDPTHPQRLFNSPFANTLGHEIRKAAYALNNLLPQPKRRMGALVDMYDPNPIHADIQQCKDTCSTISPNLNDLDGVQIPARLLEMAKGVAILTVMKGGFGFAGVEFGTGLVVARLPNFNVPSTNHHHHHQHPTSPTSSTDSSLHNSANFRWSAPSAIGTAGISWGALIGAQVSDHVFLLMSDEAVALMYNNKASIQLGADIGIAIGPLGRTLEGDLGVDGKNNKIAPIYTYSMSKGLYAGVSLDGKVIVTRPDVNEKFYGMSISAEEILAGVVPTPPAAQPLYEALHRCHVYATMAETKAQRQPSSHHPSHPITNFSQQHLQYTPTSTMIDDASYMQEYGEYQTQPQMQQSEGREQIEYSQSMISPTDPLQQG